MALKFEDEAAVPVKTRVNEFTDVVSVLAANPGKVVSYTIETDPKKFPGTTLKVQKEAAVEDAVTSTLPAQKRRMAEAGNALATPVTIRTRHETLNDGQTVKVYLWTTGKKVTRKSKSA